MTKKKTMGSGESGTSKGRGRATRRTPKFQMPDVPPAFMMEQVNRAIGKLLEGHEFADTDEMNRFLQDHVSKHSIDELLEPIRKDPVEHAQELAFQAWGAPSIADALKMAHEALALDPKCVDAQAILAIAEASSEDDVIARLRGVIRQAEEAMGPEFMKDAAGDFWNIVETRPYMRARDQLMTRLRASGQLDEAIREGETILRLNPGDNQGERYQLLGLYLETERIEDARKLFGQFPDEGSAMFDWGAVLNHLLAGETAQAEAAFAEAMKSNRYFFEFLTGRRELPEHPPTIYGVGDLNEGAYVLLQLGSAWMKHPKWVSWLEQHHRAKKK